MLSAHRFRTFVDSDAIVSFLSSEMSATASSFNFLSVLLLTILMQKINNKNLEVQCTLIKFK